MLPSWWLKKNELMVQSYCRVCVQYAALCTWCLNIFGVIIGAEILRPRIKRNVTPRRCRLITWQYSGELQLIKRARSQVGNFQKLEDVKVFCAKLILNQTSLRKWEYPARVFFFLFFSFLYIIIKWNKKFDRIEWSYNCVFRNKWQGRKTWCLLETCYFDHTSKWREIDSSTCAPTNYTVLWVTDR